MKIAFIIGTRPEIIKMSPLMDEVKKRGIDFILIHTGQHYDREMSQQYFDDLKLHHQIITSVWVPPPMESKPR